MLRVRKVKKNSPVVGGTSSNDVMHTMHVMNEMWESNDLKQEQVGGKVEEERRSDAQGNVARHLCFGDCFF